MFPISSSLRSFLSCVSLSIFWRRAFSYVTIPHFPSLSCPPVCHFVYPHLALTLPISTCLLFVAVEGPLSLTQTRRRQKDLGNESLLCNHTCLTPPTFPHEILQLGVHTYFET